MSVKDSADELELFIENDERCYRQWKSIVTNMVRHFVRGDFDPDKSVVGFMHLCDTGVAEYRRQIGKETDAGYRFTSDAKRVCAQSFAKDCARRILAAYEKGQYGELPGEAVALLTKKK